VNILKSITIGIVLFSIITCSGKEEEVSNQNQSNDNEINTLPEEISDELKGNPDRLKELIDNGKTNPMDGEYVIVDIRPYAMFERGHIPTAISITAGDNAKVDNPPPKDKYLIVYGASEIGVKYGTEKLADDGYLYILHWGLTTDWTYEMETND
jgi:rhodanese-related sulfurtransferase